MTTPNLVGGAVAGGLNSLTPKVLASMQLASGDNAVYTVPANSAVKVASGLLCNTTGSAVTVTVSVIPSGGSLDSTHQVISSYSLAAHDSLPLNEYIGGDFWDAGVVLSVNAGTAAAVNVKLSGTVIA